MRKARLFWQDFTRKPIALVGLILLIMLIGFAFVGPLLWCVDPGFIDPNTAKMLHSRNLPPSWQAPFGTDQLGRDILARMMAGGQITLIVGLFAMLIAVSFGTVIGAVAGYFRKADGLLMRLTDLFLALPLLPLLLVLVMLFRAPLGQSIGPEAAAFVLIIFSIGLTSWMQTARLVRAEVLALREREFILAAQTIGTPSRVILCRHIVPNVLPLVLVAASLGLAQAILTETALSVLGLGFPPDVPTWGRMLFDGADYLQQYPTRAVLPGLAISLTVFAVHALSDGLREVLDPRLR